MKFRKKPVVIEAIQYKNLTDVALMSDIWGEAFDQVNGKVDNFSYDLTIKTLEGNIQASVGDYIIKGIKGEFYPCKPDIFEMTYEAVNDSI